MEGISCCVFDICKHFLCFTSDFFLEGNVLYKISCSNVIPSFETYPECGFDFFMHV